MLPVVGRDVNVPPNHTRGVTTVVTLVCNGVWVGSEATRRGDERFLGLVGRRGRFPAVL